MTSRRIKVIAAFTAVYTIWGSTYAAIRVVVEQLPPLAAMGARFLIAGSVLYAVARLRGEKRLSPAASLGPIASGLVMLTASHGLVCWAEQELPSSLAAVLMATMPMWMVLLSWLVFGGRRPSAATGVALLAGFAGVWLLVPTASGAVPSAGLLALLVAPLLWALGALIATHFAGSSSTVSSTAVQMLAGGAGLSLIGVLRGEDVVAASARASASAWWALAYLAVFGALIGFGSYRWLLENVGATATSTHAFVNPMVAVLLGSVMLGERLSGQSALGAGLILLAVVLIVGADRVRSVVVRLGARTRAIGSRAETYGALGLIPSTSTSIDKRPREAL